MDNRSSVGKYVLMFEPKNCYYQYAVSFTDNDVEVTRVNKYSLVPYGAKSSGKIKKNLLGDIDKILTPLTSTEEFFSKYINSSMFKYQGYNLHKMFIGYQKNQYMYCLKCEVNNPLLSEKLTLVSGSKIKDSFGRSEMINLLSDPDGRFLNFVKDTKTEYRRRGYACVTDDTIEIASNLRRFRNVRENGEESIEIDDYCNYYEKRLDERLNSYKEYREMFLLKNRYLDYLQKEKDELKKLREVALEKEREERRKRGFIMNDVAPYEQLSLFDDDSYNTNKVKKLDYNDTKS